MIVSVVVSTDGTLQETIARVGRAIRDGKKLFRGRLVDIAVRGPRKGISDGVLTKLQYRLTNREVSDLHYRNFVRCQGEQGLYDGSALLRYSTGIQAAVQRRQRVKEHSVNRP